MWIKIDEQEPFKFESPTVGSDLGCGHTLGYDEDFSGEVITHVIYRDEQSNCGVWTVNARGTDNQGKRVGIVGMFKYGKWDTYLGEPLLHVWDRLA